MRKLFSELHLWLSLPFGVIISVICLSGAILVFEDEYDKLTQPHLYEVEYKETDKRLEPSLLVQLAKEQIGDKREITSLEFFKDPKSAAFIRFKDSGKKNSLSINPYTGEINGEIEWNSFFYTMFKLHRWIMDAPVVKGTSTTGKIVVGITTIAMLVILITGLVIWFPRKISQKTLKNRLQLSTTKGWKRFWYDTHVALGFYSTLILLIMTLTGLTWSFGWYRTAAFSLFGGNSKQKSKVTVLDEQKEDKSSFNNTTWDIVLPKIEKLYDSDYESIRLTGNEAKISPNTNTQLGYKNDILTFDNKGEFKSIIYFKDTSQFGKIRSWFYALHVGSFYGLWSKIIYFIITFIGGTLPLTGYYLWIKKRVR